MAMTFQTTAAKKYSKKLDIDGEADFAKHHTTCHPRRCLDESPETTAVLDLHQFFRKEFKCVLDGFVTQFRENIQPTLDIIAPLQYLLHEALPTDIKAPVETMPSKVDSEVLAAELEVPVNILSSSQVSSKDKLANVDRVIQFAYDQGTMYPIPLRKKLYKLMLTASVVRT